MTQQPTREPGPLDGASPALATVLTVRFLIELALLAGVGVLAWILVPGAWGWVAALLAVGVVGTIWGLVLSPRARIRLPSPAPFLIEAALFLGVGAGLIAVGHAVPAVVGVVIWALDRAALARLQRAA